jgi:hypothetical protein
VPCLSARQQRRFRAGYEHRPQDVHDLAQLDTLRESATHRPDSRSLMTGLTISRCGPGSG